MNFFERFGLGAKEPAKEIPSESEMEQHAAEHGGGPAEFAVDGVAQQPGEALPYETPDMSGFGKPTQERGAAGPADASLEMPVVDYDTADTTDQGSEAETIFREKVRTSGWDNMNARTPGDLRVQRKEEDYEDVA